MLWCNVAKADLYLGSADCGIILDRKDDREFKHVIMGWMNGFISAVNAINDSNVGDDTSPDQRYYFIIKYCKENPLKNLHHGTLTLYRDLRN